MSYRLKILKDNPIAFWPLDESTGTTANDISGCSNHGSYFGGLSNNLIPLVPEGLYGTLISSTKYVTLPTNKNYYGSESSGLGNKYNSDNDFSIEFWFYSKIDSSDLTTLFADSSNNIGVFYQNGNIIFKLNDENLEYSIPNTQKSVHVVCTYDVSSLSIYTNGTISAKKPLTNFIFTNEELAFQSGPANGLDTFIIDAPAVYRYSLDSKKIADHFLSKITVNPIQIVQPDVGTLFQLSDKNLSVAYKYELPLNKSFSQYDTSLIYYDDKNDFVGLARTETAEVGEFIIEDYFTIPQGLPLISSKVEWLDNNWSTVETSVDGISYETCVNGDPIPQYKIGNETFSSSPIIYFRITLSSPDTSRYLSEFKTLVFSFYVDKNIYAINSGEYVSPIEPDSTSPGDSWDYSLSSSNNQMIARARDGLKCSPQNGFQITTTKDIKSIEFTYTPESTDRSCIVSTNQSGDTLRYSWGSTGTITKSNINTIYVNGINRTSATNISTFLIAGEPHHIVINLIDSISTNVKFNSVFGGGYASESIYQNIGLYENELSSDQIETHFNLYTSKSSYTAQDSSFTMTEVDYYVYDNDWIVIQTS
jgi:hypothetical protein